MKVNFAKLEMYTSIRKDSTVLVDVKETVANTMYTSMPGIAPASLAMKIYNSDGEVELTQEEVLILDRMMGQSSGIMRDSWNRYKEMFNNKK